MQTLTEYKCLLNGALGASGVEKALRGLHRPRATCPSLPRLLPLPELCFLLLKIPIVLQPPFHPTSKGRSGQQKFSNSSVQREIRPGTKMTNLPFIYLYSNNLFNPWAILRSPRITFLLFTLFLLGCFQLILQLHGNGNDILCRQSNIYFVQMIPHLL